MNRRRVIVPILIGVLAASAWETGREEPEVDDAAALGDSAYQTRLRSWRRDSAVLDSVTRGANTDALYALYRQALSREGVTLRLMTDIGCEQLRVAMRYGAVASERAINAMLDTVYRDIGVTDGLEYLARHAPREGWIETGSNCPRLPLPAPDTIGVTRLDIEYSRPRPQRRVPDGK